MLLLDEISPTRVMAAIGLIIVDIYYFVRITDKAGKTCKFPITLLKGDAAQFCALMKRHGVDVIK